MLLRTLLAPSRLIAGGALGIVFGIGILSGGTLASAQQVVAQAATATPRPAAATATPVPCVTQPVGVQIVVENPSPGDVVQSGQQLVINGVAYDTGSTTGPGIASVQVYFGNRDTGGVFLGNATLGQSNPLFGSSSPYANAGFTLRTPSLPSGTGGRDIFVYAKSLVGNAEGVLDIPVFLNAAPTPVKGQVPTAVLPPPPACTPTPAPTDTPTPIPAAVAPAAVAGTPTNTPLPTPTPFNLTAPLAPAPAPAAAAPAPAAPAPAAAAPAPVAVSPAVAPNGGGIPSELGLMLIGLGALVVAGGAALMRRERRQHRQQ